MLALGCLHCEQYQDRCASPPQQRLLWKRCNMNGESRWLAPKRYLLAHPTRLKRLAVAVPALLLAQINSGLAVADLKPIG